jgi:hypothetical protein
MSFADAALFDEYPCREYLNVEGICPTSVIVESLFSQSKWIFNDRRMGTTPEHVEELMFLRCNHFLWDLEFFSSKVLCHSKVVSNDEIDAEIISF